MVYQPREDTWLIIDALKELLEKKEFAKALDMGTGSGVIAKNLAQNCREVVAVDIDPEAIEEAKRNVKADNVRFVVSDLFQNLQEKFDLIVFNPPYLPPQPTPEKFKGAKITEWAGGRPLIQKFLEQAKTKLVPGGSIILLLSNRTGLKEKEIERMGFELNKLEQTEFFYEKLFVYELKL